MATSITAQAGKGLLKHLLVSTPHYRAEHERIFGKRPQSRRKFVKDTQPGVNKKV